MNRILVSRFDFQDVLEEGCEQVILQLPSARELNFIPAMLASLGAIRGIKVAFFNSPKLAELLYIYAAKLLQRDVRIVVFDLLFRAPRTLPEKLISKFKAILLRRVDKFIFVHRDIGGYSKFYGIPLDRSEYVPFKANNFDLRAQFTSVDGDYVLALGASHRDYPLLISAMRDLPIPLRIVLPESRTKAHNSSLGSEPLPENVQHINREHNRMEWSSLIANSRFVVIPILPGVIQPAGISVYLEAMLLGKPVIISRGASTENLINMRLAEIVPTGDVKAMRDAIVSLWDDKKRREELSINGRAYCIGLEGHSRLQMDLWKAIKMVF